MKAQHKDRQGNDWIEAIVPWGLALFSGLTAFGAGLRMFAENEAGVLERIDSTTLLYLVVAAVLLLLRQIKTFSFGDVKLEMLEKVKQQQFRQESKLDDLALIMPLLLPEKEQKHLINLAEGKTKHYEGNSNVRNELRRLRSIGLITMKKGYMKDIEDGKKVDLSEHVELTSNGRRWTQRLEAIEESTNSSENNQNETNSTNP